MRNAEIYTEQEEEKQIVGRATVGIPCPVPEWEGNSVFRHSSLEENQNTGNIPYSLPPQEATAFTRLGTEAL